MQPPRRGSDAEHDELAAVNERLRICREDPRTAEMLRLLETEAGVLAILEPND